MNRQNMYYQRYSNYRYPDYMSNFNTAYYPYANQYYTNNNPSYYNNQYMGNNTIPKTESENVLLTEEVKEQNVPNSNNQDDSDTKNDTQNRDQNKENGFRLGPLNICDNTISIFGFSLAIDDLILIGIILLLFFESERDYTLLIILGLMLFNFSLSSLNIFN